MKEYIGGLVSCPAVHDFVVAKEGTGVAYDVSVTSVKTGRATKIGAMGSQGTLTVANSIHNCEHGSFCQGEITQCWFLR